MKQNYEQYTREDHDRWAFLYNRSQRALSETNREFREGLQLLNMPHDQVPRFEQLNEKLNALTGWQYQAADEPVTNAEFMTALAAKTFLATTQIRSQEELDFCKLPDIFHDVFGHAAMLTYAPFCTFLETIGKLCIQYIHDKAAVQTLANIYWYTAEVGLVTEDDKLKYYGGSVISSFSEIERVYSTESRKIPFSFSAAGSTGYDSYAVNDVYFVTEDLRDLDSGIPELTRLLHKMTHIEKVLKSNPY
jgi:phenylalanine-4-hydroxylase